MSDRRLLHYSLEPLTHLQSKEQVPSRSEYAKPTGLWLSAEGEDDWFNWCEDAEFWQGERLVYEVVLADTANLLYLNHPEDVRGLMSRFSNGKRSWEEAIDWVTLATEYQGIIIAPYHWQCRLEVQWYYGWDCASGCIWDVSAVEQLEPLTPVIFGQQEIDA
jgi:hypothetical protein